MTRIVQLSTYPSLHPVHGGQIRAHYTGRVLEAAGFEVIRLPFFCWPHHPAQSEAPVIDLTPAVPHRRHPQIGEVIDFTLSSLIATDEHYFAAFAASLDAARPDIVMLEEPWLWPALRRWRTGRAGAPPVLFNSHNVETQAKAGILADAQYPEAAAIIAEIEALERDLAASAAAISVTTARDAETFRSWSQAAIAVAQNGTVARNIAHLHGVLPQPLQPGQRYLLFIGSGHPPNAAGFLSLVLPALPWLRSHERIVLAGGVCKLVAEKLGAQGPNALVRDRTVFLGPVSNLALDCLISNASGILLPITYGGGSNIKTAEALVSGLPVVGTSTAFRGFESYQDLPQVTIADTPEAFRRAMQHRLQAPAALPARAELSGLYWETTLQPIVTLAHGLAEAARAVPLSAG